VASPEGNRGTSRQELVLEVNERWNAGEREIRAEYVDPECEVRSAMTGLVYHGYDGVRAWMKEIDEQFESWRIRLDEFADLPDGRLLTLGSIHLHGRGSGIDLEVPCAWLYEFRDDRILQLTIFSTHDEGRRAAGVA
jgi:ketosteroid isomerase-like protein